MHIKAMINYYTSLQHCTGKHAAVYGHLVVAQSQIREDVYTVI